MPGLDFHLGIIKLSKNERLVSTWQTMQSQLSLVRVTSTTIKSRYLTAFEEHKKILALIGNGDFKRAEKLLKRHLLSPETTCFHPFPTIMSNARRQGKLKDPRGKPRGIGSANGFI